MDHDDLDSAALEAALLATRERASQEDTLLVYLGHVGMHPGRFPSVRTCDLYPLYRDWCGDQGQPPLQPFDFARTMWSRFRKAKSYWAGCSTHVWLVSRASAERLRRLCLAHPVSAEDKALFSFAALNLVSHPRRPKE